jgi:hypothetical protein
MTDDFQFGMTVLYLCADLIIVYLSGFQLEPVTTRVQPIGTTTAAG